MSLLLPAVERGMSGDNWRIRQSSLELCGDMLFKVSGLFEGGRQTHNTFGSALPACKKHSLQSHAVLASDSFSALPPSVRRLLAPVAR